MSAEPNYDYFVKCEICEEVMNLAYEGIYPHKVFNELKYLEDQHVVCSEECADYWCIKNSDLLQDFIDDTKEIENV